ncbi:MAG: uncharacterized protein KVP18_004833 [Porospora cf. gigantea A]|uniref:uncharacterized protein n=1 Tax=Porospora cf. gigantea A TaxID=2853593 RepID=UPI0035596324|nr:MAG: hypothetical protein KVP18_004833 [Porospora cf. gigantea A]
MMTTTTTTDVTAFKSVCKDASTPSTVAHSISSDEPLVRLIDKSLLDSLVYEATSAGQTYREGLLRGLTFVVICCGCDIVKKDFYADLKSSLGVKLILLEDPTNRLAQWLETNEVVSRVCVDMTPRPTLVLECVSALNAHLRLHGDTLNAICTFWDDAVTLTARLCAHFGVPGNSVSSIDIAHDKSATREALARAGLTTPIFRKVLTEEEALEAGEKVGYPCILKPVHGAASLGVQKILTQEELIPKYRKAARMVEECYENKDLMGLVFDDADGDVGSTAEAIRCLILESFLDGPEVDVDMVISEGEPVYMNIVDDWPLVEPYLTEWGNSCPSILPSSTQTDLKAMARACCSAFGIQCGTLHVELKFDSKLGPVLIELNPRMGGGNIRYHHRLVWGVDLAVEQMLCSAGLPSRPVPADVPMGFSSSHELFAAKSGRAIANSTTFLQELVEDMPSLSIFGGNVVEGDVLTCWADGWPSNIGRVAFFTTTSMKEAKALGEYIRLMSSALPIEAL